MNYRLAYAIGFHPWEDAERDERFVAKISEMFDREERGREPPFGRALDLGTGSGIWALQLAKRGWQVTGVDVVEKALQRARDRVSDAGGPDVRFVLGDVTALRDSEVGSDYRLILDTGTFHGLDRDERAAMGKAVDAVAAQDATVLLLVWPRRRRPLIRGASRDDVESAFPGWSITHVEPSQFHPPKVLELLLRPDEHWYRLSRAGA